MKNLLEKINSISKKYEEIAKIKKENFNVFSILRKEHEEEGLHSNFLAELLNPNGSHDMGNIFLNIFMNTLNESFDTENITVYKEYSSRNVDGRIDIYLSNGIAIENKIWASDQDQQLKRYKDFLEKERKEKHLLIYLTLDGKEASKESTVTEKLDYRCLSYKEDICKWLKLCLKEVYDYPTLRESIKQYLFLIQKLTGQSNNSKMEEEIKQSILEDIKSAKVIYDNYEKVINSVIYNFSEEIKDKLEKKLNKEYNIKIQNKEADINKRGSKIKITLEGQNNEFLLYCLEGISQKSHFNNDLYFGVLFLKSEAEKKNKDFEFPEYDTFEFSDRAKDIKKGWWKSCLRFEEVYSESEGFTINTDKLDGEKGIIEQIVEHIKNTKDDYEKALKHINTELRTLS